MLPYIWIIDTYSLMIFLGVLACFILFWLYRKKYNISKAFTYDIFILACIAIAIGIIFAVLFQLLFDAIKGAIRGTAMTFYGGLVGGIISFIIGYFVVIKKLHKNTNFFTDIVPIAPACITMAHAFGRVGCFMAGCCYGVETDSWLGVQFPHLSHAVYPTQLFEAIFLFALSAILFYIAIKKRSAYTLPLYLMAYGIFRFCIEFLRGDNRGAFLSSLSPSQWFSIIAVISSIIVFIFIMKIKKVEN